MAKPTVGLVGASGETGKSILNGLVEDGSFNIVALARSSSLTKPSNLALKDQGVELRAFDMTGSDHNTLVKALKDINILICAVGPQAQLDQIPLATAAAAADVKRFVPCAFITVMAPGQHLLRDQKEEVYNHVKRLKIPYTIIDCGWWYQISFPALPSGKIDYAVALPINTIAGDGNVKSAITDARDIGRYVARVIKDERTLNRMVLVYDELWTQNEIWGKLEQMSGEKVKWKYESQEVLEERLEQAKEALKKDPESFVKALGVVSPQYRISWGCRGDNTPEYAKYLGYLTSKELYPDFKYIKFEDYLQEVLDGKAAKVYDVPNSLADAVNAVRKDS